jgi:hypothetical protein
MFKDGKKKLYNREDQRRHFGNRLLTFAPLSFQSVRVILRTDKICLDAPAALFQWWLRMLTEQHDVCFGRCRSRFVAFTAVLTSRPTLPQTGLASPPCDSPLFRRAVTLSIMKRERPPHYIAVSFYPWNKIPEYYDNLLLFEVPLFC